jgi:asparagine synthase (glutamine-hydrolysing)
MCGIVAIFNNDKPVNAEELNRAVDALVPRGPDEQNSWFSPNERVALGHARLNIMDPETGTQPIASEDGKLHIIHNGEFYDFERIRTELESRGHKFRTRSDSEIALHLYQEMGPACLEHLRGEFAFIIWDEGNETLFAARDRFGIKPLFYTEDSAGLKLASESKALFAAGVPAAWDEESVFQNLFFSFDQNRTLFKDIRQLSPGHYLIAKRSGVTVRRYWDVGYPKANAAHRHTSETECIDTVSIRRRCLGWRAVTLRANSRRLRSPLIIRILTKAVPQGEWPSLPERSFGRSPSRERISPTCLGNRSGKAR